MPDNEDEERIDEYVAERQAEIEKRKFQEGQDVWFRRDLDSKWKRGEIRKQNGPENDDLGPTGISNKEEDHGQEGSAVLNDVAEDMPQSREEEITGQSAIQPPVPDKDENTETVEEVVGLRRGKRVRGPPKRPYDDFLKVRRRC
ncbi:hypothetical protein ACOME3_005275 [Neoechinorhynchus agilis]